MSKKGSLSLSINAIVVLILAVTLLSLGLAFITNTFGGATGELDEALKGISQARKDRVVKECEADACLEYDEVELQLKDEEDILLVINNKLDCTIDKATIDIDVDNCQVIGDGDCSSDIELSAYESRKVNANDKITMAITVYVRNSAQSTTYGYPIIVDGKCGDLELHEDLWLDVKVG